MNNSSGKSRRRLTQGNGAAWPARERSSTAAADVWPATRKSAPPKIPPAAPPNSLATSVWSRDGTTIGGRSSVASLRAAFQPNAATSEDSGSTHTALALEDDWVPSYQRFKGGPSAAGGAKGSKAATVIGWPNSSPYAAAMSTLAALGAGLPPQPLAPLPEAKPAAAKAPRPRPAAMRKLSSSGNGGNASGNGRAEMFPDLEGFRLENSSSSSSSRASGSGNMPQGGRPAARRQWSSDTEAGRAPLRGWSSDTEVPENYSFQTISVSAG